MREELRFLEEQEVDSLLIQQVEEFRREYPVREEVRNRVAQPSSGFQSASERRKGDRKEYSCRESVMGLWETFL